ncbi:lysis protein [Xenorhabdus budapestensis]|uniref:Lysis protein n=1 Tax=Xenorhabdus budapestensis TaxID=290110 RepID=A0ABX7VH44_XENBU|nr:lysis protein [Xenorhabdus budapestensis]QTL38780.1 lysis protein [Xenorhabdus budapestensis]
MKFTLTHYTIIVLIGVAAVAIIESFYYLSEYEKQKKVNGDQATEIQQLTDAINYQNTHIEMLHELDKTHTQELAHAKTEINTLRADVAAGRRKLRIKAACPVPETTSSGSVVNGTPVELTGETGSTVLDIREGIINDRAKLKYLQDYVNTECGRKD